MTAILGPLLPGGLASVGLIPPVLPHVQCAGTDVTAVLTCRALYHIRRLLCLLCCALPASAWSVAEMRTPALCLFG